MALVKQLIVSSLLGLLRIYYLFKINSILRRKQLNYFKFYLLVFETIEEILKLTIV